MHSSYVEQLDVLFEISYSDSLGPFFLATNTFLLETIVEFINDLIDLFNHYTITASKTRVVLIANTLMVYFMGFVIVLPFKMHDNFPFFKQ